MCSVGEPRKGRYRRLFRPAVGGLWPAVRQVTGVTRQGFGSDRVNKPVEAQSRVLK